MNNLRPMLSDMQISEINDCLEKLYIFQDKPINENKKAILVQELMDMGLPYLSIVQGIKDIYQTELRSLKLATIIDSIRKRIDNESGRADCIFCHREGSLMLKEIESGMIFALSCKCSNGDITYRFQKLERWNGLDYQISNGRRLDLLKN